MLINKYNANRRRRRKKKEKARRNHSTEMAKATPFFRLTSNEINIVAEFPRSECNLDRIVRNGDRKGLGIGAGKMTQKHGHAFTSRMVERIQRVGEQVEERKNGQCKEGERALPKAEINNCKRNSSRFNNKGWQRSKMLT